MSKIPVESYGASQTAQGRPAHFDRDSSEELSRILGGIGALTESRAVAARVAAAIDDIGSGCG